MAHVYTSYEEGTGTLSDGDLTHESINLEQLEAQHGRRGAPAPVYETETLTKRDYYTAKRKSNNDLVSAGSTAEGPIKGNMARCEVIMLDGTCERFDIDRNAKGLELFNAVCSNLDLMEKDYFGITYRDSDTDHWFWLNMEKKVSKQVGGGRSPWKFEFQVKFYPPDPENLKEDLTRYYLCLQIRQDIISSKLPCSFMTYVQLGSYVVQSEMGDFDGNEHRHPAYIQDMPFCPHEYHSVELLDRINELHRQHRGQHPELADLNFLENSKRLAMYGVDLHQARDSRGEDVFVGVFYDGVLIYRNKLRINRFSWPKIIKISYERSTVRITVRASDGETEEKIVEFKCPGRKLAKRLWRAVVDHHGFFRLKVSEKPKRPTLMPGKHRATYSGPTRNQIDDGNVDRNRAVRRAPPTRNAEVPTYDDDNNWGELPTLPGNRKGKIPVQDKRGVERLITPSETIPSRSSNYFPLSETKMEITPPAAAVVYPQQWARRPDFLKDAEFTDRWRLSPTDSSMAMELLLDGLSATVPPGYGWQGTRSNKGVRGPGLFYYEATVTEAGLGRVGWSTIEGSLELGLDNYGYGYGADPKSFGRHHRGRKLHGNAAEDYGEEWRLGDVVGCYIDLETGMLQWSINGAELGPAFYAPPAVLGETFYPAACLHDGAKLDFNFGDDPNHPLLYPPHPDQWTPVGLAQAPSNCVPNPFDWRLNPYDATEFLNTAPDGHSAQSQIGHEWQGQRANKGVKNHGRYYFESAVREPGLARVGWSTERGSLDLGADFEGFGYGADHDGFGINHDQGKKVHNGEIDNYGQAYSPGDIVGCFVDLDDGIILWSKNGNQLGSAFNIPPRLLNEAFYPTLSLKDCTMELNFGEKPFYFYPGNDWIPVCHATPTCTEHSKRPGMTKPIPGYLGNELPDKRYPVSGIQQEVQNLVVTNRQSVSEEYGEPQVELITTVDEFGNKITKKITKIKKTTRTKVIRTVEGVNADTTSTEHPEISIGNLKKGNLIIAGYDDGFDYDLALDAAIYGEAGFDPETCVQDESVNDFSMSTQKHETEI